MPEPYLALGLTGPHLLELTTDPTLLEKWDALPLAFTVLGIDRIDGSEPRAETLDASAVAAVLARRTGHARFLVAASPQRDHPYNLARRVASLGHLSRGRSGVLFGVVDGYAPPGPTGQEAWGGAGLGVGAPLTTATAHVAARAVRDLEQSWPYASIVGDRETGILVRSDEIVHVDLDDTYAIAGPLNVPEPPTGASVVAWYDDGASVPTTGSTVVDLTIRATGGVAVAPRHDDAPSPGGDEGFLLRAAADESLDALLARARGLLADRYRAVAVGGSLRQALGLAVPERPEGARPAFPAPQPQIAL